MAASLDRSNELVAKPTPSAQVGGMLAAAVFVGLWTAYLTVQGPVVALEAIWLLILGVPLGAWCLLMRLRFGRGRLLLTVGPWRRGVDLEALERIRWKAARRPRGAILVWDRHGGRVPIYVGRFTRIEEWGPLLLDAARRSGATVDSQSRQLLEGGGAPRRRRRR
jgi:hypothetical protein